MIDVPIEIRQAAPPDGTGNQLLAIVAAVAAAKLNDVCVLLQRQFDYIIYFSFVCAEIINWSV